MILADLHIHSTFSDGKMTIPELVDLYGSRGFGAIAITDHLCEDTSLIGKAAAYLGRTLTPATFPLYQEILKSETERAWERYRMVLIPGFELTRNTVSNHRSAHIVALGCSSWIDASAAIEEQCERIRDQGGLAVAAHPVSTGKIEKQTLHLWSRRKELSRHFDAWEVASGKQLFDEVLNSGLPLVASSDLHRKEHLSSWKTLLPALGSSPSPLSGVKSCLAAIREQRLRFTYFQEQAAYGHHPLLPHSSLGADCALPVLGSVGGAFSR